MNNTVGIAVLAAVLGLGNVARGGEDATAHHASSANVPDKLMIKGGSAPFFISLASLRTAAGSIDWTAVPEPTETLLRSWLNERQRQRVRVDGSIAPAPDDGPCNTRTITPDNLDDGRTWSQIVDTAPAAYRGKIIATSPGIIADSARPATFLAVEITRAIRTAPGYPVKGVIYVQTSAVDIVLGGERFCDVGQHDGFKPAIGDAVLIFPSRGPVDEAGVVFPIADERMVFFRNGSVRLPVSLSNDSSLPRDLTLQTLTRDAMRPSKEHR